MSGHILSVQDLSCAGRCSLAVTLPVVSAMGIRCSALPTAVLSTHTAFPDPEAVSLTEQLLPFARHWQANGIVFDAVVIGYLSDPRQGEAVAQVLQLQENHPLVILDPVMGDNGTLYSRINAAHLDAMGKLARQADVLLPNLTEAAALTGLPYRENPGEEELQAMLEALLRLAPNAVITGIRRDSRIGVYGGGEAIPSFRWDTEFVPRSIHGTGDLFTAVFSGALTQGASLPVAARRAGEFVRQCVLATPDATLHGVEFEAVLPLLFPKNNLPII